MDQDICTGQMKMDYFQAWTMEKLWASNRFEDIMRYLQLSNDSDPGRQIIEFLHAVNTRFRNALHPGS